MCKIVYDFYNLYIVLHVITNKFTCNQSEIINIIFKCVRTLLDKNEKKLPTVTELQNDTLMTSLARRC